VRRAAKADTSQLEIVKKLRQCGVTVEPRISRVGQGVPDLLCGYRGRNILLEIKTGARDCDRRLTQDEQGWHESWSGQVAVVSDWEEAMDRILEATV
jgi:hypothetical protein